MNIGRISGFILLIAAILICSATAVLLGVQLNTESTATIGGQLLGFILIFIFVVIPLAGVGGFLLWRGRGEEAKMAKARAQRTILNMVLAQGKVRLDEVALELNKSREEVEDLVRDLIGKQLFTGAINWQDGLLYSVENSQLRNNPICPNCGGELELAGKGMIICPWCGAEVFLHLG